MTIARSLIAASLTLALVSAYSLVSHTASVRAQSSGAIQVHLNINGKSRTVTSTATQVSDLLAQAGVTLHSGDEVRPPLSTRTSDGMNVSIHRSQTRLEVQQIPVAFKTTYKRTIRLLPGRQAEAQPGKPGLREAHYRVTTIGGRETGRTFLRAGWIRQPQQRIVLVGTEPYLASRGMDGVRNCRTMLATKYDVYLGGAGTGHTRTGLKARRGIVAIDPRVIPLHTHLWVEGYGYCVAEDTGGAIKGNRIDLCVETPGEANLYGAHRVRVLILDR